MSVLAGVLIIFLRDILVTDIEIRLCVRSFEFERRRGKKMVNFDPLIDPDFSLTFLLSFFYIFSLNYFGNI